MKSLSIEHIFESSPDIHCLLESTGMIRHVNARLGEVLGWSHEDLMSQPLEALVHPDELASGAELGLTPGEEGEQVKLCMHRFMCKDGSWRWIEWSRTPMPDGVCYVVGRDMTERVTVQLERAQQQRLFEESLKLSKSGYYTVDVKAQAVFWSEGIYIIHGVDPRAPTPPLSDAIDFYHPEDRAKVNAHVDNAIMHGTPFDFQLRLIRANDGQERLVHSIGFPRYNEVGEVSELFGIFRDLTDDISTVRQEELEYFAYMTSHDLREPLRIMRMYMGLLAGLCDDFQEESQLAYWSRIQHSAERMDALIAALSSYAVAGQRVELTPVSLDLVVKDACAQLSRVYDMDRVDLQVAQGLPVVFGDHMRLCRAFVQVLDNAIKFSTSEGEEPRVRVDWLEVGSHIEVIVSDEGPGFEGKFAERVFQPFSRLTTQHEGTGMGLAIAKRIIRQCDGNIWAVSAPRQGASFHILLLRMTQDVPA